MYRLGVGACIINRDNKVFIAERLDILGAWQLIQGGIDEGEEPEAALFREVLEETGIHKNNLSIITQSRDWISYDFPKDAHYFGGKYKGQKQLWYALRFLGDDSDINLNYTQHPEFSRFQWVDLANIEDLAVEFKKTLYQKIIEEFSNVVK
ncbi:MAG: RNA pyrophosphohydrolase [Alphaproteobacteria bacterium]